MVNCPACGKWFASEFQMKGHLRLSNDYRHVSYTGKKISRKHVRVATANLSKQTVDDLLKSISSLVATIDKLIILQQQSMTKPENVPASENLSRQTDSALWDVIPRVEAKLDNKNKLPEKPVINIETPTASQPKKMNWWEYAEIDKNMKSQSPFAPSDEYLNSLVESGYSRDYVKYRALGKY